MEINKAATEQPHPDRVISEVVSVVDKLAHNLGVFVACKRLQKGEQGTSDAGGNLKWLLSSIDPDSADAIRDLVESTVAGSLCTLSAELVSHATTLNKIFTATLKPAAGAAVPDARIVPV